MNTSRLLKICLLLAFTGIGKFYADSGEKAELLRQIREGNDSVRAMAMRSLSWKMHKAKLDSAILLGEQALSIAERTHMKLLSLPMYRNLSVFYYRKGEKFRSAAFQERALNGAKEMHQENIMADVLSDRGLFLFQEGDYASSLKNSFEALRIYEKLGSNSGRVKTYINIGVVLQRQKSYREAQGYFHKAWELSKDQGHKPDMVSALVNIGLLHMLYLQQYDSALVYLKKGYAIQLEINDLYGQIETLVNIGVTHDILNETDSAMSCYRRGYAAASKLGEKRLMGGALGNIAELYSLRGKYKESFPLYDSAVIMLRQANAKDLLAQIYSALADAYKGDKNFEKALQSYVHYVNIRDTLFNEKKSAQITEMQAKYDSDKKDTEILLLNKEQQRQKMVIYFSAGTVLILICSGFFVLKAYQRTRKANREILHQKDIIEEKNKDIMDSINYAKRIQQSLLPTETYIQRRIQKFRKGEG